MADSSGGSPGSGPGGVDRLGEPGPGVPTQDQRPTNETEGGDNIVADVHIPGPHSSEDKDGSGEPAPPGPEPTKGSRDASSLGDVVEGDAPPATGAVSGSGGSGYRALHEHDNPETLLEEAENVRAESFPGGVPADSDLGSGRRKGQGVPPGSVDKGEDTPQTPAT